MKTIIAGSRDVDSPTIVADAVEASGFTVTEVVSGAARGVDTLGEQWAADNDILVLRFPADWKRYGRAAGPKRNEQMAEYAEALIAIWDGESRGTKHMIDYATKLGLVVYVHRTDA